ncbi:MAG: hypothetical protein ACR2Q3_05585 [Woeseiaceae bacterium]
MRKSDHLQQMQWQKAVEQFRNHWMGGSTINHILANDPVKLRQ